MLIFSKMFMASLSSIVFEALRRDLYLCNGLENI